MAFCGGLVRFLWLRGMYLVRRREKVLVGTESIVSRRVKQCEVGKFGATVESRP